MKLWEWYLTKLIISIKNQLFSKNKSNWLYWNRIEKLTRGAQKQVWTEKKKKNEWNWGQVKWEDPDWGTTGKKI